ncbi:hypothetical protein HYFRA_00000063 [Hymenoscyphus fraxineus]|uniref:Uncharacterized protein n=1 Tax=Hymenoscyphus fraxineus TaxID=746836 RepID=A0A9N9PXK3_9HELO|nr:hypothetical protein HYFRA_00000063 [Hymenoscyphus fraxineus]
MYYSTLHLLLATLAAKTQAYPTKHEALFYIPDLPSIQKLYQPSSPPENISPFTPSTQQPLVLNPTPETQLPTHPSGKIHMLPTTPQTPNPQPLTLTFTTSQKTCPPLASIYTPLLEELSSNLLADYPTGIQSVPDLPLSSLGTTVTVSESIKLEGGFYASFYLTVSGGIVGVEWERVVRLLTRTAEGIGLQRGAGVMSVFAKIGEVEVSGTWGFYRVVGGVVRECWEGEEVIGLRVLGEVDGEGRKEDL